MSGSRKCISVKGFIDLPMKTHLAFGRKLKRIERDLNYVAKEASAFFPTDDRALSEIQRVHKQLNLVRSRLEARMHDEHGDPGAITVYFGPRNFYQGK